MTAAGSFTQQIGCADDQVLGACGRFESQQPRHCSRRRVYNCQRDLTGRGRFQYQRVVDADGRHHRFQVVKPVGSFPDYAQKQIELGRSQHRQRSACLPEEHVGHILLTRSTVQGKSYKMKDQSGTEKDLAIVERRRNCDGMDWNRKPRKNSLAEVGGMLSRVRSISQDNFQAVQSLPVITRGLATSVRKMAIV